MEFLDVEHAIDDAELKALSASTLAAATLGLVFLLLKICLNNLPIRQFRDKKIVVVGRTFAI